MMTAGRRILFSEVDIMEIEEFVKIVTDKLRAVFGCAYHVEAIDVPKNNGVVFHGVSIMHKEKTVSPCIYLDGYYEKYVDEDIEPDAVVEDIIKVYNENTDNMDLDISLFTNYGNARPRLRGRLINTERNKILLEKLPHREFLDLSLTYYVEIDSPDMGTGRIQVHYNHMEMWGVNEEELYQAVTENMESTDVGTIQNMMQMAIQMAGLEEIPEGLKKDAIPLYVLSNRKKQDGAVQMMNKRMLKTAAIMFGRDFMVLPSSVNEVLLVPVADDFEEKDCVVKFADMVREVNDTQVEDTEILSYHVYRYCADTETVVIAA